MIVVNDGETLDLGEKKISFHFIPWVHWPETMVTWVPEENTVFAGDAFGTFGSVDEDPVDGEGVFEQYRDEMIRYYSNIVGKYGVPVQAALKKLSSLPVERICSTHGPVWQYAIKDVVALYDKMSRYEVERGVCIVYGSMYGNTAAAADALAMELEKAGVPYAIHDLACNNAGELGVSGALRDVFKYDTIVVGSPTYNNGIFPPVDTFMSALQARLIKGRRFYAFGSYTWAPASVRLLNEKAEAMGYEALKDLKTKDVDEIVKTIYLLSGSFGGINLEDIAAPRCFEIEKRLKEICDIPIFHDDQHGTAIVVAAALINALKLVKKDIGAVKVVINGAGSAGIAIGKHLMNMGVKNLTFCDRFGIICEGDENNNPAQEEISKVTNLEHKKGTLADALNGADVFIGVSAPNLVTPEMVKSMASDAIMFPMANPTPEIMPDVAKAAGARVVGTGRSDFPNQINNVLAFPGIFRGALDCRATCINEEMKVATSFALASLIPDDEITEDNIIAPALDKRVAQVVAEAVIKTAKETGVARK